MLVLTAFTSLLFAIPAALLRCRYSSACFAALVPVSFTVHALGGRQWRISESPAGRALVLLDKGLAQVAGVATTFRVVSLGFGFFTAPFFACLGGVVYMYYACYPKPPACWVAHHATFHLVVVTGTVFAALCGA